MPARAAEDCMQRLRRLGHLQPRAAAIPMQIKILRRCVVLHPRAAEALLQSRRRYVDLHPRADQEAMQNLSKASFFGQAVCLFSGRL